MTNSTECRRRQVLASLVPAKARTASSDLSLTDYNRPSVLELQRNQSPDNAQSLSLIQNMNCSQNLSQRMDRELQQVQEQWHSHEDERFDLLLQSPRTIAPRQVPELSNLQTEVPTANYSTSLRQLDHIERLLHTAGDSLPTSLEAQDFLVTTQCYAMALEQLTTMTKSLETHSNH